MIFCRSTLLRFDSSEGFVVHQQLLTKGAISVTSFVASTDSYLIIANEQNNFGDLDQSVDVYSWNVVTKMFVLIQKLPVMDIKHVHVFYMEETMKCMIDFVINHLSLDKIVLSIVLNCLSFIVQYITILQLH